MEWDILTLIASAPQALVWDMGVMGAVRDQNRRFFTIFPILL